MQKNFYNQAEFVVSAHKLQQLPMDVGIEVAFSGRSNSGKSSVLNIVTGRTKLARTSKTPGRTQQLNVFVLDQGRRLVDLPGYGYAKVPVAMRQHWAKMINDYFLRRQALAGLVLIVDVRHCLREGDLRQLEWAHSVGLAVHVVLNKSDKLSHNKAQQALQKCSQQIIGDRVSLQLVSCLKRIGVEELRTVLDGWFEFVS